MRAAPLVTRFTDPFGFRGRLIDVELQPVDSGSVEETQLDGAGRFGNVLRPPLAESIGRSDKRVNCLRCGFDWDGVSNVCYVYFCAQ